MLNHFMKIALRNLTKRKGITFIQLLGLTLGLSVFWIITQYVRFEKSYDQFYTHSDNIFRLAIHFYSDGKLSGGDAMNYAPAGPAMASELSDVKDFLRITPEYGKIIFRRGEALHEETKVFYADSSMFSFFDYPFIEGSPHKALDGNNKVVLTLSLAERYFGPRQQWTVSPVGQLINFNHRRELLVSGIVADSPPNTHFKFNALISFDTFQEENPELIDNWGWNDFYTYVLTPPETTEERLQSQMAAFVERHKGEDNGNVFKVQPLRDIHLHSHLAYEAEANGDGNMVNALAAIAFIILIIAWINYINLATARSEERAKEVGIRKVTGASKARLIYQFLGESFLVNFISIAGSILLAYLFLPYLGDVLDKPLSFVFSNQPFFWLLLAGLLLGGTLCSGLYPAFVLSSFYPLDVLKGSSKKGRSKNLIRKGLVTFQFVVAMVLITGTLVIHQQINFIQNKSLGFSLHRKLIVNAPGAYQNDTIYHTKFLRFKDVLRQFPAIKNTTLSSAIPGRSDYDLDINGGLGLVGSSGDQRMSFWAYRVDDDFIDTYGFKIVAGRKFSWDRKSDDESLILNQAAVQRLGFDNPEELIGEKIDYWGTEREIIGVVENYHHKSPKSSFLPMILRNEITGMLYYTLEIEAANGQRLSETIDQVQEAWAQVYPDNPFTYFFLEDHFNEQFKEDLQIGKVFASFAMLAILITCLGLFGLSSYMVVVRMKEIGIRKVLGASTAQIMTLLSRDYLYLIVISSAFALPLGYYFFDAWLENFAWHIDIAWWLMAAPLILVGLLSLLTVSGLTFKAARLNPVNTLRDE